MLLSTGQTSLQWDDDKLRGGFLAAAPAGDIDRLDGSARFFIVIST